jgi:amidase
MEPDKPENAQRPSESFDLVEATIADCREALEQGVLTSVELVVMYLNRIARYDRRGPRLNAIPVLNPHVLAEAAEADCLRAAGHVLGPLHGIPFTVKDSFKVKGLTVAAGSPAFAELVANEDAAAVAALRHAGAILLGKTNMPPMAIGGAQRGLYGRAESPYNPDYLAAAWHSGSSIGSAVAVAANFCAFSLGEETVSSGRSPASNNGLVAYTPSRGLLSVRGNWPLFALRDVVVPLTRTVDDMLAVLDALMAPDEVKDGDLWRSQTVVDLPTVNDIRPASFSALAAPGALKGLRIGVPRMYVGADPETARPIVLRPSIRARWDEAATTLTALGATLVEVDYPVVSEYEKDRLGARNLVERGLMPDGWNAIEIGEMVAASWEEFLTQNRDANYPTLGQIRPEMIHADPPEAVDTRRRKSAHPGRDEFNYPEIVKRARQGIDPPLRAFPQLPEVIQGLESARATLFEDWMKANALNLVAFPANADIGTANADVDQDASDQTWRNGTVFSNMNHVMRHLGIPSVSVTMGLMEDTSVPVNLTFAGRAYADADLLRAAFDYERASRKREAPPEAPALPTDRKARPARGEARRTGEGLRVAASCAAALQRSGDVLIEVRTEIAGAAGRADLAIYVDGVEATHQDGIAKLRVPSAERRHPSSYSSLVTVLARDEACQTAAIYVIVNYSFTAHAATSGAFGSR